jgi:conserved hypothetical protein
MGAKKRSGFWKSFTDTGNMTKREYISRINTISIFVALAFLISIAVFVIIAWIGGIDKVIGIIEAANLWIYLLAFVLVFFGYLLRFIKWNYYLKKLGIHVPLKKNLVTYLSLYSMNITPGKFGRVIVAYTLNRITKNGLASTLPVVTFDIFTDFVGIGILALITALYFKIYVVYVLIIDIALMVPYLFILNSKFYNFIKPRMMKSRFFLRFTVYGDEYFAFQSKLNKPKVYLVSIATSLPAAVFNALALYLCLVAVGVFPNVMNSIFIQTSSTVLGMATGSPGNIGVTDGTLLALLRTVMGLSVAKSSAVTIMERIATLWFGVGLGAIFLFYSMRYWKENMPIKKGNGKKNKNKKWRRKV